MIARLVPNKEARQNVAGCRDGENVFEVSKCVDMFWRFFCQLISPCHADLTYTIPTSVLVFVEGIFTSLRLCAGSTLHIPLMLV